MFINPIENAKEKLQNLIKSSLIRCGYDYDIDVNEIEIFEPKEKEHGEFTTNIAMKAAGKLKSNPRSIATSIVENLNTEGSNIERVEIAGPGFINFYMNNEYFADVIKGIIDAKENYGRSDIGKGQKVMVEFVSANPTGPMHMGNARGGVIGDTLATILSLSGYDVTREFYVNDAGNQIDVLSKSLSARYIQLFKGEDAVPFPEDGYHGDDVKEHVKEYAKLYGDSLLNLSDDERGKKLVEFALKRNIEKMKSDLEKYKIKYDVWFFESQLHESGYVEDTVNLLKKNGYVYEKDGALWFKATEFGLEKDEVLRKQNGFYTYYAVDIAYHRNKFLERHFDKVIDVFGADHHGHTLRFKAGISALHINPEKLNFVLIQLVRLMQDGQVVRMSKRTGKTISLSDLLNEIPVDAARFFFNYKVSDSAMDFDLDLALKQNSDNPVYYVQYAHARICSIIKNLEAEGVSVSGYEGVDLTLLNSPEERDLIKTLAQFPEEIKASALSLEPTRITRYIINTASCFHRFYNSCYVRCENKELMYARLLLCWATKQVIYNGLKIINISAPEKM